jgi:hypothetical protein
VADVKGARKSDSPAAGIGWDSELNMADNPARPTDARTAAALDCSAGHSSPLFQRELGGQK